MCGIFGVFTSLKAGFSNKQLEILGQNMIINQFRGTDSTGVISVNRHGKSEMLKVLGGAGALFAHPEWDDLQRRISKEGSIVVGHGRSATRGTVKIENAHPFAKTYPTGEIFKLVHNGTLDWDQDLPDFRKFDVDSEWITEMIVRYGAKEALTKIRGAMALVWWDEKEETINFFRNVDRPLHFGRFKGQYEDTFILNSEAAAVRYLSERNGLTPFKKDTPVFYFAPHTHYALKVDNLFGDWHFCEEYDKPKPKVWPTVVSHGYSYNGGRGYNYGLMQDDDDEDNPWSRTRSFEDDLRALQASIYRFVEFDKRGDSFIRRTQTSHFSIMQEPIDKPYQAHLTRMERVIADIGETGDKPWIRLSYNDGNRVWMTHIGCPEVAKQESPKEIGDWKHPRFHEAFAPTGCTKLSPGRKFRWNSRVGNTVIKHSATIGNDGGHVLKRYRNDHDGAFEAGTQIIMEVQDVVEVTLGSLKYYRCDGQRVETIADRCVDMCVYFPFDSIEGELISGVTQPCDLPFIQGIIDRVELATKDWHQETGAFAVCVLTGATMLSDAEMELASKTEEEKANAQATH